MTAKIGLGSVQFGMDYGLGDHRNQVSLSETAEILSLARTAGVDLIDTAAAYGQAERVLGQLPNQDFRMVSKIRPGAEPNDLVRGVEGSLELLNRKSLDALLFHRFEDVNPATFKAAETLVAKGTVGKLGVSVYLPTEIEQIEKTFSPAIVQLPLNWLDNRWTVARDIEKLKKQGAEIHVRSVFLQGLLIDPVKTLSSYFDPLRPYLNEFQKSAQKLKVPVVKFALDFVRHLDGIDYVILGVQSLKHWQEILTVASQPCLTHGWPMQPQLEQNLIDPRFWPKNA